MNIQRINLQNTNQNVNFKGKINAPETFWTRLRVNAPEHVARRALTKILEKPGTENQVITINEGRGVRWMNGKPYCFVRVYRVAFPSGKTLERERAWVHWSSFLPRIAKGLGPGRPHGKPSNTPLRPLEELIAAVKA